MALCFYSHIFNGAAVTFGLESQNIVGYSATTSVAGFNFYTPTFKKVASEAAANIQDITLGEGGTSWSDNIQVLDEGGSTVATYYYVTKNDGFASNGWTEDGGTLADVPLAKGQSVIVETASDGVSINFSGEVDTVGTEVSSVAGFNFVGNNTPAPMSIQSIELGEGGTSWSDNIQVLDEGGSTIATSYYVTKNDGFASNGWTEDGGTLADISLEPGQGIIVETASEGISISMPSAL